MGFRDLIRNNTFYQKYRAWKKGDDLKFFLKRHQNIFGYTPDFNNPKTFNEKIVHRILFDRNPLYTALADKLKARIYITHTLAKFSNSLEKTNNDNTISLFDGAIKKRGGGGKPFFHST